MYFCAVKKLSNSLNKIFYIIGLFWLLICSTELKAIDVKDFSFSHLGKNQGVENLRIFSICSTNSGALWWASKTGVSRYNGSEVFNYGLQQKTYYGNQGGRVIHLVADSVSLYAFDNRGFIFLFNPIENNFVQVSSLSKYFGHEVALNDVFIGQDGLYLALHNGVFMLKDSILTPLHQGVWVNRIIKIKNKLYYLTREGVLNEVFKKLLPYHSESAYYDEKNNKLWLGGYENGLNIITFNGSEQIISDEFVPLGNCLQQYPIRSICPYTDDVMLVGVDGLGVYQISRNSENFKAELLFDANGGPNGVLHGNGIYSIVVDDWNNIVIGSYSGGIDIARPVSGVTAVFKYQSGGLLNGHVNTVLQLNENSIIFGTDNGVSIFDTKTSLWKHCCQGVVVLNTYKTSDGKVLVLTYGQGVYEIDSRGNARQLYTVENGVLKDDHVYAVCCDNNKNLWFGCLNGELVRITPKGCDYFPISDVQTLLLLKSGKIAVGTAFSLKLIDTQTLEIEDLNYAPPSVNDFNPFVTHIFEDGTQKLWIATDGGGVYVYDLLKKTSIQITVQDGLPTNYVSSIEQDSLGRIWIATEDGLAFVAKDNPKNVINVNYYCDLNCGYSHGAVVKLLSGDILYGTNDGAVIMNPESLQRVNYKANFKILRVESGAKCGELSAQEVYEMLKEGVLTLDYNQRTFIIYFESINMRYHFDIAYRYKLENGIWSEPSFQQFVRFDNLEPGRYELVLQAFSRTGGFEIDSEKLTVVIKNPWWYSWQMKIVYVLVLILIFYVAWRVYRLQEKYMRLTIEYTKLSRQEVDEDLQENEEIISDDMGKEFVDKATKLILEHLSDSEFTINSLCKEMAVSRTLFYVKLKSYTGKSPQDFIRIIRLERAATLLRSGSTVSDAAMLTGFDNPKYFSTVFKKYFDIPPSKYQ